MRNQRMMKSFGRQKTNEGTESDDYDDGRNLTIKMLIAYIYTGISRGDTVEHIRHSTQANCLGRADLRLRHRAPADQGHRDSASRKHEYASCSALTDHVGGSTEPPYQSQASQPRGSVVTRLPFLVPGDARRRVDASLCI